MKPNSRGLRCNGLLHLSLVLASLQLSCIAEKTSSDPLAYVLTADIPEIKRVMEALDAHEVQIRYTQIDRYGDSISLRDYDFQVAEKRYFYPASTVKFPVAVLALEKLAENDTLTRTTRFYVEGDSVETTFAQEISKIFAVSDNAANNRLVEFLGQDDINDRLLSKGIAPVRISHRLSTPNADDVTTQPLVIYLNDSTTTTLTPTINRPIAPLELDGIAKGTGFYVEDSLMNEPFDFSLKNYFPIDSQHEVLKRLIFPEIYKPKERFSLDEDQRRFLLKAMHTLPKALGYDPEEYYDSYGKFFLFGDSKAPIPSHIKIYNKVGYAYGTLTDCAYILDTKNEVEFLLTATILVNKDGVFNDDAYEYDEIGIPFLAALGRALYQYELTRKK